VSNTSDSMVKEINESDFEKEVFNSKELVLVDFYADWCPPCKALSPIIEELSSEGKIKAVKINIDSARNLASKYQVMSIPTMILFKNGEKFGVKIGLRSKSEIEEWINQAKG